MRKNFFGIRQIREMLCLYCPLSVLLEVPLCSGGIGKYMKTSLRSWRDKDVIYMRYTRVCIKHSLCVLVLWLSGKNHAFKNWIFKKCYTTICPGVVALHTYEETHCERLRRTRGLPPAKRPFPNNNGESYWVAKSDWKSFFFSFNLEDNLLALPFAKELWGWGYGKVHFARLTGSARCTTVYR